MPAYDFQCVNSDCEGFEKPIEVWKKMSDSEPVICEKCGGEMKKVFVQKPKLFFKGGGWTPRQGGNGGGFYW